MPENRPSSSALGLLSRDWGERSVNIYAIAQNDIVSSRPDGFIG
jgi:hypothetical protein